MKRKKIKLKGLCIVCSSVCLLCGLIYFYLRPTNAPESLRHTITSDLSSKQAMLTKVNANTIYFKKNIDTQIAPASLTKIMSVIIAIESFDDYDTKIKITGNDLQYLAIQHSSLAGFNENESVSVMDLLYGSMLSSGGEATIALARGVAGSERKFVSLMNQKARELSLTNTHYDNSCGFDSPDHYSSVEDITKLLQYSLQNSLFKKIFTTKSYTTAPTSFHPNGITLNSTMFSTMIDFSIDSEYILGGKTGYTENAGLCLASIAVIDNQEYIFVSTGAKGSHTTYPNHIEDAIIAYRSILS